MEQRSINLLFGFYSHNSFNFVIQNEESNIVR